MGTNLGKTVTRYSDMTYEVKGDSKLRRTPELYARLKHAYATVGLNHSYAAKLGKCGIQTAKKAFEVGWPEYEWGAAIKEALQAEGVTVRARINETDREVQRLQGDPVVMRRLRDEIRKDAYTRALKDIEAKQQTAKSEREAAQVQAVKVREDEAELAKFLRLRAKALLGAGSPVLAELINLGKLLTRRLALLNATPDHELSGVDPRAVIAIMSDYTKYVKQCGEVIQAAQVIDRKAAGDPDFVMAHRNQDMSYEEALKVMATATDAYTRNQALETEAPTR